MKTKGNYFLILLIVVSVSLIHCSNLRNKKVIKAELKHNHHRLSSSDYDTNSTENSKNVYLEA